MFVCGGEAVREGGDAVIGGKGVGFYDWGRSRWVGGCGEEVSSSGVKRAGLVKSGWWKEILMQQRDLGRQTTKGRSDGVELDLLDLRFG